MGRLLPLGEPEAEATPSGLRSPPDFPFGSSTSPSLTLAVREQRGQLGEGGGTAVTLQWSRVPTPSLGTGVVLGTGGCEEMRTEMEGARRWRGSCPPAWGQRQVPRPPLQPGHPPTLRN